MQNKTRGAIAATVLAALASAAQAHTGHGTDSFMVGLSHPIGLDHLLAMLVVGVWSVNALPAHKAWQGPAAFMVALAVGAAMGMVGMSLPYLEHAVALSVVLFGVMLASVRTSMPVAWGLGLIAAAASLHGLAHGAEAPASGFAGYFAGFLLTTALLHAGGLGMGVSIKRWFAHRSQSALTGLGAAMGGAGVYLLGQLAG